MDGPVKFGDSILNSGRIIIPWLLHLFHSLLCSILLHVAADWKHLVRPYPAGLWGLLSLISVWKFCDPHLNHSGEIRPKAVRGGIFSCFSNFDKCRPEVVAGDVISGVSVDSVGTDDHANLGDYRLNSGWILRLSPKGPILRTFMQYLIAFCSWLECLSGMLVWPIALISV